MNLKDYLLALLLTLIVLQIETVKSITEGSLIIKINQRFCIMLIYDDTKDTEPNINNIIVQSCLIVIEDKIKPTFLAINHDEALIKTSIENLKDKLTKLDNLYEDYFFNINSILIGCDNHSKQHSYKYLMNILDYALVSNGFIINYNNIVVCNTDELLAQMALDFSYHKQLNTNKDNLLVVNIDTSNHLNTECIAIQPNKIAFITEARANILEDRFDKNISFLYYSYHSLDYNVTNNNKIQPKLHIFKKPFHIYKVYNLAKHNILDCILIQEGTNFKENIRPLHQTQLYNQLLEMDKNNLQIISKIARTNIKVMHLWMEKSKADYTILMGELLLSNAVFSLYQQYLLHNFSKDIINKIYIASKNDFLLALISASKKFKSNTKTVHNANCPYKIGKITTSN